MISYTLYSDKMQNFYALPAALQNRKSLKIHQMKCILHTTNFYGLNSFLNLFLSAGRFTIISIRLEEQIFIKDKHCPIHWILERLNYLTLRQLIYISSNGFSKIILKKAKINFLFVLKNPKNFKKRRFSFQLLK